MYIDYIGTNRYLCILVYGILIEGKYTHYERVEQSVEYE